MKPIQVISSGGAPWWQPFLAAAGGAVLGGLIALYSAARAEKRRSERDRIEAVRGLIGDLLFNMNAAKRLVGYHQIERKKWMDTRPQISGPAIPKPVFDKVRGEVYVLEAIRAGSQLAWYVGESGAIGRASDNLNLELHRLVDAANVDYEKWVQIETEVGARISEMSSVASNMMAADRREASRYANGQDGVPPSATASFSFNFR